MMAELPLGGSRPVPPGWVVYSIDQIRSKEKYSCVAGPFGSDISSKYFVDGGVPVIRGQNLRDDLTRFVPENFVFVSEERARKYHAQHVQPGDLVFTCWGTIGQVGIIPQNGPYPEYIISNKQLKLRVNPDIAESLFVYYYLASREGAEHIRSKATGAAVPGINLGILKAIRIALPNLSIQREIVQVLSAYDDLIENNTRRIALLEESMRLLYRKWFVRLCFPGHEGVKVVDGLPERWERTTVASLGQVITGKTPSTAVPEFYGQDIPFIKIPDMTGRVYVTKAQAMLSDDGAASQGNKLLPPNSLMVSCIGTIGVVSLTAKPSQTNQQINSVIPFKSSYIYYAYFVLQDLKQYLIGAGSNGATMGNVNKSKFEQAPIVIPREIILEAYHRVCMPVFDQILNLQLQNERLQDACDLLLPRLMSGEIAV